MTETQIQQQENNRKPNWKASLAFYGFAAMMMVDFIWMIAGFNYVASDHFGPYHLPIFLVSVASMTLLAIRYRKILLSGQKTNETLDKPTFLNRHPLLQAIIVVLALSLFPFLFLALAGPGFYTIGFGQQDKMIVTFASQDSDKTCRKAIKFEGKPLLASKVCGLRSEFRNILKKGDQIVIYGKKSWFGIVPENVQKVE